VLCGVREVKGEGAEVQLLHKQQLLLCWRDLRKPNNSLGLSGILRGERGWGKEENEAESRLQMEQMQTAVGHLLGPLPSSSRMIRASA
jgi:hypothetical protein